MSYKSGLGALCAITSLLIAATGCGGKRRRRRHSGRPAGTGHVDYEHAVGRNL